MTYATPAARPFPLTAFYLVAAAVAAVAISVIVAVSTIGPLAVGGPSDHPVRFSAAVIESARQWELERAQQSGHVDPTLDAARRWVLERGQQSGYMDPLIDAGNRWEAERRQQSGTVD